MRAEFRGDDDIVEHVDIVQKVVSLLPLNGRQVLEVTLEMESLKTGHVVQSKLLRHLLTRCGRSLKDHYGRKKIRSIRFGKVHGHQRKRAIVVALKRSQCVNAVGVQRVRTVIEWPGRSCDK